MSRKIHPGGNAIQKRQGSEIKTNRNGKTRSVYPTSTAAASNPASTPRIFIELVDEIKEKLNIRSNTVLQALSEAMGEQGLPDEGTAVQKVKRLADKLNIPTRVEIVPAEPLHGNSALAPVKAPGAHGPRELAGDLPPAAAVSATDPVRPVSRSGPSI